MVGMSSSIETDRRLAAIGGRVGSLIRLERRRRGMTQRDLAGRANVSPALVAWIEAGNVPSTAAYVDIGAALGLRLEIDLIDPRRSKSPARHEDPVHAAMGEWFVKRLEPFNFSVALDEPYQHYQFAGRADVLAWRLDPPALLHVENRTRFRTCKRRSAASTRSGTICRQC